MTVNASGSGCNGIHDAQSVKCMSRILHGVANIWHPREARIDDQAVN